MTNLTNSNGKRVLWYSNPPWFPSGYGNQTALAVSHLRKYGHEMAVLANAGLRGTRLEVLGANVYPGGLAEYSNDIVQAYATDWDADVIISLYDAWPLEFAKVPSHETPWIAWAPVDHLTVPPAVVESLRHAQGIVAFSKQAFGAFKEAGFERVDYIPHGVATDIFIPGDQFDARDHLGMPEEKFIFGMVANNAYYPSRKSIDKVIIAFAQFLEHFPDALLYLHMVSDEAKQGVHTEKLVTALGIQHAVGWADRFDYSMGYSVSNMVRVYQAMDVLLNPSMGEGFGIPIVEAMSCGTPVIVSDVTSMPELAEGHGFIVETELAYSPQGALQGNPPVDAILDRMLDAYQEATYDEPSWKHRKKAARQKAVSDYDFAKVVAPAWDAYLRSEPWGVPKPEACTCVEVTAGADERRRYIPADCPIHDEPWEGDVVRPQGAAEQAGAGQDGR